MIQIFIALKGWYSLYWKRIVELKVVKRHRWNIMKQINAFCILVHSYTRGCIFSIEDPID